MATASLWLSTGCSGSNNPGAPQRPSLTATVVDAHAIKLEWVAVAAGNGSAAAAYDLRVSSTCPLTATDFGAASPISAGSPKAPGTAETVIASGLISDVSYCFLLKVSDAAGGSTFSNGVSATTRDDRAPAAPNLTSLVTTTTSVTVGWTATGDNESAGTATSQELRYLSEAACPIGPPNFSTGTLVPTNAPSPAGAAQSTVATGLSESKRYCFLLKVTDEASNTAFSNVLNIATADSTVPAFPVLEVDTSAPPSETQVRLKWTDVGDDGMTGTISRQTLRYWPADFCLQVPADAAVIDVPVAGPAGTADGVTLTVQRTTIYCFLLTAYDEQPNAASGGVLRYRTPDLTPPASPALSVDVLSPTTATLRWTDVGNDGNTGTAQAYMLHGSTGAGCATFSADNLGPILLAKNPSGPAGTADSFEVTGLNQGADYCLAVRVIDAADNASVSNVVTFQTPLAAPGPVTDLKAVIHSSTAVQLTFTEAGRHGSDGTVPSYDVRYATGTACDPADWYDGAQAVPFDAPPVPSDPGSLRFGSATLDVDVPLCFALQAVDGTSRSLLSNVARPPARIPNLAVTAHDESGADFSWTAVGAQHLNGTAASSEMILAPAHGVCPSEGFLLGGELQTVKDTFDVPAPLPAGTQQTAHIPAQMPGHAWCASLRTVNGDGSASLSNVVSIVNPDSTPPGQPGLALAAAPPGPDTISLSITAAGDDGTQGAAEGYEVRALAGCSDPGAFNEVAVIGYALGLSLPYPAAGSTFHFDAFNLTAATDYCFAAYAFDTLGNQSVRSTVVVGRTADQ